MNPLKSLRLCFILQLGLGHISFAGAATFVVPDERDKDVLNTLLTHLCADVAFDLTKIPTNGGQILLHYRTPEKTGFLMPEQIQSDLSTNSLPFNAEENLRKRNGLVAENPGDYETVSALFGNVKFGPAVLVTNIYHWRIDPKVLRRDFSKAFPNARGWVEAYLPGYSKDGKLAVVRAMIGPSAHAASLTALLEKRENTWAVKWYKITYYW